VSAEQSLAPPGESGGDPRGKPKKRYHHGDLRRALIDDAVRTIAGQGIGALNLRQLAAGVGVTSGAPYHHFASREALLAAIADDGFCELEARLIAARKAAPTAAGPRLKALGEAYVQFAIGRPGYFRVMFHGDAMTTGPTKAGLRAFELLREAVLVCQSEGAAPAGDPAPLVLTAWSAVHGFATLCVDGALPFQGIDGDAMASAIGQTIAQSFAALARSRLGSGPSPEPSTIGSLASP
jgi:AcrR family transcriptional regulator